MKFKYCPVGLVDGTITTENSVHDKFSVENKLRFIQRSASAQKIESIRNQYDKLIATPKKLSESGAALPWDPLQSALKKMKASTGAEEPEVIKANHCFTKDNWDKGISLSVYNRPKTLVDKLPVASKKPEDYLKTVPGYKPPAAAPASLADPVPEPEKREPRIKQPVFAKEFS